MARVCDIIAHEYQVTSVEFRLLRYALRRLVRFYTIIHQHGHHMPREAGDECFQALKDFLRAQNGLGQHYRGRDTPLLLFHATFKSHLMWHLGEKCRYFNPRCGWCYRHGSFVGRVAKVAKSVVAGLGPMKVALSLAKKWRYVLHLRIWQQEHGV